MVRSSVSNAICLLLNKQLFDFVSAKLVKLFVQRHDFYFRFQVYFVVMRSIQAALNRLPVLTHHDYGRPDGGQHRQQEIEKDVGVWIEGLM